MFPDVHSHCWRKSVPRLEGQATVSTPESLLADYELEIAVRYPDRFIPFCNVHPQALSNTCDAPLKKILLQYRDAGCKGVGEITCNRPILDPFRN